MGPGWIFKEGCALRRKWDLERQKGQRELELEGVVGVGGLVGALINCCLVEVVREKEKWKGWEWWE